jgi:hypothetical protein
MSRLSPIALLPFLLTFTAQMSFGLSSSNDKIYRHTLLGARDQMILPSSFHNLSMQMNTPETKSLAVQTMRDMADKVFSEAGTGASICINISDVWWNCCTNDSRDCELFSKNFWEEATGRLTMNNYNDSIQTTGTPAKSQDMLFTGCEETSNDALGR